MTTHTPGPWRVEEGLDPMLQAYYPEVVADGKEAGHTRYVARLFGTNPDVRPETDANARLIAAAPALLAACREALTEYESNDCDPDYCTAMTALREAIAKAVQE